MLINCSARRKTFEGSTMEFNALHCSIGWKYKQHNAHNDDIIPNLLISPSTAIATNEVYGKQYCVLLPQNNRIL